MMRMSSTTPRRVATIRLLGGLLLAAATGLNGCGWLAANVMPTPKIPAQYELDRRGPVLVFVQDMGLNPDSELIGRDLTSRIYRRLEDQEAIGTPVPYENLMRLHVRSDFYEMSVDEIARTLGAKQVLLVRLDRVRFRAEGDSFWRGELAATISVRDPEAERLLWPAELPEGMQVPPVELRESAEDSPHYHQEVRDELVEKMADRVAKYFYEHRQERI